MKADDVLAYPPLVLTAAQRAAYFSDGFLILPDYIPAAWLDRLRDATAELMDRSRRVTRSDSVFVLEEGHAPDTPRLHRVTSPQDQHPAFWRFICDRLMTDLAADVVGPDVKFHHAKLNVKSERGTRGFKWHQDIPAWPHTNYSPVTLGVYLDDVPAERGPLTCVPGSHLGPIFVHRDDAGKWTGSIRERDMRAVDRSRAEDLTGDAGTVVAINCRTIHASRANRTDRVRPVALFVYSSADAFPWTAAPTPTTHTGEIVRGQQAQQAHLDGTPCPVPPDWSKIGYGSIFSVQRAGEAS